MFSGMGRAGCTKQAQPRRKQGCWNGLSEILYIGSSPSPLSLSVMWPLLSSYHCAILSRRHHWKHQLSTSPAHQGSRHQPAGGEAQVLLHLQDVPASANLPLQPVWQLCGWAADTQTRWHLPALNNEWRFHSPAVDSAASLNLMLNNISL